MLPVLSSLLLLGAGCMWPPPLDTVSSDGGNSNRPVRLNWKLTVPLLSEKSLTVEQTSPGKSDVKTQFSVVFDDPDRTAISVRLFLDRSYGSFIFDTKSTPTPTDTNGVMFIIGGLCDKLVNGSLGRHDLEVYITDSSFVETGDDLRVYEPGGSKDNALWALECVAPTGS